MKGQNKTLALITGTNTKLLSLCILLLRCTVGIILFMVGTGKVFGWFGGHGMQATIQAFARSGFAPPLIYLSMFTEFIGGFLFMIGFLTRPAAVPVIINMLVATLSMMPHGFLMGFADFPFSILVSSVIILLAGPMKYSLDSIFFRSK